MKKIGIFGGSFNPVHKGHTLSAEYLIKENFLDKIIFIPAYIPPLKNNKDIADVFHRLNMLRIAISENKNFDVSEIEIKRKGVSYTIDTLTFLKEKNKEDNFFLIMGTDLVKNFNLWKDYEKISEMVDFLILERSGINIDWNTLKLPKKVIKKIKSAIVKTPNIPVSASEIRKKIKKGDDTFLKKYLDEKVYNYILKYNLYM